MGVDANVGWMQRQERDVLLGMAALVAPLVSSLYEAVNSPRYHVMTVALMVIAVGTHATLIVRGQYVVAALRAKARRPRKSPV